MDFPAMLRDVGRRIAELREDGRLTQEQLAERLDVSVIYLRRIELGSKRTSLEQLARIADTLGASMAQLFEAPRSRAAKRGRPKRRSAV